MRHLPSVGKDYSNREYLGMLLEINHLVRGSQPTYLGIYIQGLMYVGVQVVHRLLISVFRRRQGKVREDPSRPGYPLGDTPMLSLYFSFKITQLFPLHVVI